MNKKLFLTFVSSIFILSACSKPSQPTASATPVPTAVPATNQPETPFEPVVESGVVLEIPDVDTAVSSPLAIEGLAPGTWFFEGQIQGEILSESGESLVT